MSTDAATRTEVAGFRRFQFISSKFLKKEHDDRGSSLPKESRADLFCGHCQSKSLAHRIECGAVTHCLAFERETMGPRKKLRPVLASNSVVFFLLVKKSFIGQNKSFFGPLELVEKLCPEASDIATSVRNLPELK